MVGHQSKRVELCHRDSDFARGSPFHDGIQVRFCIRCAGLSCGHVCLCVVGMSVCVSVHASECECVFMCMLCVREKVSEIDRERESIPR